jgi:hypothetical protein
MAVLSALAGPNIFYTRLNEEPKTYWMLPPDKPWVQNLKRSEEVSGFGVFNQWWLDYESSFGAGRQEALNRLFSLERQALLDEGIELIVSTKRIEGDFLELLSVINEAQYIYRVTMN